MAFAPRKGIKVSDQSATGDAGQAIEENWRNIGDRLETLESAGGGGGRPLYPVRTGQFYGPPNSSSGASITLDVIRFTLFPYDWEPASFDQVGLRMANVGTGNAKLGRYSIDADGLPDALLTDYGTVALDGSLPSGINTFAITESILNTSPFYYLAYLADTTLSFRTTRIDATDDTVSPLGWTTVGASSGFAGFAILSGGPNFAAGLPATLSAPQKASLTGQNLPPLIQLRSS